MTFTQNLKKKHASGTMEKQIEMVPQGAPVQMVDDKQ